MSPLASLLLIGALVAVAFTLAARAITNASNTITSALAELDQPTRTDEHTPIWTLDDVISRRPISADENAWETERHDSSAPLRDIEAAVIRDWQDMPYDIDLDGGI